MRARRFVLCCGAVLALLLVAAPAAFAGSWWSLDSRAAPSNLTPGGEGLVLIGVENLGDAGVTGASSPITITDTLPEGLSVAGPVRARRSARRPGETGEQEQTFWKCTVGAPRTVICRATLSAPAYERLNVTIPVTVEEPAGTVRALENHLSVSGGETEGGGPVPAATQSRLLHVNPAPTEFGLEENGYQLVPEEEGGTIDTRAGSHPFQLTSTLELNQTVESITEEGETTLRPSAPALPRNLTFQLPPGLLGDVNATEQCSEADFKALEPGDTNRCPAGSAVGVVAATVTEPVIVKHLTLVVPLFAIKPSPGEPARFGFEAEQVPVLLDTSLRSSGDYGVTVSVTNTTQAAQLLGAEVTFWGVPSDARHDSSRGWACLLAGAYKKDESETCSPPTPRTETAFLTLPTACSGPLTSAMAAESWPIYGPGEPPPGRVLTLNGSYAFTGTLGEPLVSLDGCEALPFAPGVELAPEQPAEDGHPREAVHSASTPSGLGVDVKVDQNGTVEGGKLADAAVRSTTVTLPQGVELNPSAANGLEACSEAQVGYEGTPGVDPLSPGTPQPMQFSSAPATCPLASKLGTVRVKTPLLGEELTGSVYLAAQNANPFGSLIALYLVVENQRLGLRVKLAGEGQLNESNGQITTTFVNTPQVPFEELKLQFFGGQRGSLSTPAHCGSYATSASFTPWSTDLPVGVLSEPFVIDAGAEGTACQDPLAFGPSFMAGVTNLQAGAFTGFSMSIGHPDADQPLASLTVHLPAGIAAVLASVTPCPEPPAGQAWSCGPQSLVGHSTAWSGLGNEPVALPGSVYLTAGYGGAPFGLLVATRAKAGPFDLGEVDVRSKILVDPNTAAVTVLSDPLPQFVKGVPAQIKRIDVNIDRPNFEFNPTNCAASAINGTLTGNEGAPAPVSSHFQVTGCAGLPFAPKLTASVAGQGSRVNGTKFTVRLESAGIGQANIHKVVLQLPKQLPSRLETLKKACLATTFSTNPASCNPESVIGTATIHTPVLKNPLTGPAYLVSHGNAAFPDVEFVLQGEGVTVVLDGQTDIKNGVTYSKFETAPDAPFTSFETVLPAGPKSVLAVYNTANSTNPYSVCGTKLSMPTTITAQNGAVIEQQTGITTQDCGAVKAFKATRAQKLAKALATCRKKYKHKHTKRQACEHRARKKYGTRTHAKKTKHKSTAHKRNAR